MAKIVDVVGARKDISRITEAWRKIAKDGDYLSIIALAHAIDLNMSAIATRQVAIRFLGLTDCVIQRLSGPIRRPISEHEISEASKWYASVSGKNTCVDNTPRPNSIVDKEICGLISEAMIAIERNPVSLEDSITCLTNCINAIAQLCRPYRIDDLITTSPSIIQLAQKMEANERLASYNLHLRVIKGMACALLAETLDLKALSQTYNRRVREKKITLFPQSLLT